MSVVTASAKLLEPVLQMAQHYRMEPSQVLNCVHLTYDEFTKPGARFPASRFNLVLQALAEISNNPLIALNLGEATQPRLLGSIGFLISTAPTLDKAYQTLVDYFPLLFEGAVLHMEQTIEGTLLTIEMNSPELHPIEYFLACLVNWPRSLTGQQVPVNFVRFTFSEPENPQSYQRFFAAEVEFDAACNQILLPSQYLAHSCLDANEEMHQLHREFADSLLSKSNQQSALIAQTRHLIRQQLNEGGGTVRREQVAACVGLSLRTLQRKLGALGTNFQDVYDHTRKEISLQHIQRGQLSFGEIAFQLGFSNQSAFQKAFKRWMGLAPSSYRQQINPAVLPQNIILPPSKPTNTAWLEFDNIQDEIKQRIIGLNGFNLQLLEYAALFGERFTLAELSKATDNPVARIAIHLWPAEQLGLITSISLLQNESNSDQDEKTAYVFSHIDIRHTLNECMTDTDKAQRHLSIGEVMFDALPSPFSLDQIKPVLAHLNDGAKLLKNVLSSNIDIPRKLKALNIQAALLAESQQEYLYAQDCFKQAYYLLPDEQHDEKSKLLLESVRLLLLGGRIDRAQEYLTRIPTSTNLEQVIVAGLMQAKIYQHKGLHTESLTHLQHSLAALDPAFPDNETEQLSLLLTQLHEISDLFDASLITSIPQMHDQKNLLRLQLLEQISLLARQQRQPLLAACAISQMALLTIKYGHSSLTAFSFVSYAWVASWFCADFALAQDFSEQGMELATGFRKPTLLVNNTEPNIKDKSSLSAVLFQSSQVLHWFTPLEVAMSQLQSVDDLATAHSQWLIQSDCRVLRHQLMFFSAMPLTEQSMLCQESHASMVSQRQTYQAACLAESTQLLLLQLCSSTEPHSTVTYRHGWQAVSTIIGALLLDQQSVWPDLFAWEASLENELAGYFCVAEALFCTAMMRLIQSQQQHNMGRKRRLEIEQIESRLELWARHCPANFKGQLLLLQAEKSRLLTRQSPNNSNSTDPAVLFEQAIKETEIHEFGYHKALCYERYADYLHAQGHVILARFCLNESSYLYQRWGASAKVEQLRQAYALLAI
ncbi:AraC family transcriptional regulator ligand-binding domain-containing protein [Neptunomonas sp.]|uniref:AraC family transcriptional regulator n=1 Tax=Neptunomonas sp. TaxID=1971898 RepID=UPI0025F2C059|nr:AraC family transcriptional regulator ligand-binding domain-containing protein [Neptunomonas sp.]